MAQYNSACLIKNLEFWVLKQPCTKQTYQMRLNLRTGNDANVLPVIKQMKKKVLY